MHECVISMVATDGLVLEHQAISIHSADQIFIALDEFHTNASFTVNNIKKHLGNIMIQ